MYEIRKATREKRDEMQSIGQETLSVSGIVLLKSFNREGFERDRYHRLGSELMNHEIRLAMVGRWFMALISAMVILGPACIWLYGGWLCIHSGITVGLVVTFVSLLSRLYTPVASLAGVQIQVMTALAVFERIFDYLDLEEEKDDSNLPKLNASAGEIKFDHVSFAYPNGGRQLSMSLSASNPDKWLHSSVLQARERPRSACFCLVSIFNKTAKFQLMGRMCAKSNLRLCEKTLESSLRKLTFFTTLF